MLAIILAGGKGTRLRPFTFSIPKPLLPIGDYPILEIVIRQLAASGFTRVALTLNHMADHFRAILGDGSRLGVSLEYYYEEEPLGTAGSIRMVKKRPKNFLVMNGDVLTTLDFGGFLKEHMANGDAATIATKRREVNIDYGVLVSDRSGRLVRYREKPSIKYSVSMGVYALSSTLVRYLPKKGRLDMPDLIRTGLEAGLTVRCKQLACYWQDIGRFDDYERASADFLEDPARFVSLKYSADQA